MSNAKVALGRALFSDPRLSRTGQHSCASCHRPEVAFSDGRPQAIGVTGERHRFGAPSLLYIGYARRLGWASPELEWLEDQVAIPLLGHAPIELGMGDRLPGLLTRLASDRESLRAFALAFPESAEPVSLEHLSRALAAYQRTLTPFASAFDRWALHDEDEALSPRAQAGATLFASERLGCAQCHRGLLFGDASPWPAEPPEREAGVSEAASRFRVPILRNIARTAPYLHDGRLESLDEVISFYARGGDPDIAHTHARPLVPFALDAAEKSALLAFLESLNDPTTEDEEARLPSAAH